MTGTKQITTSGRPRSGFTLIEISIVLVIIGLVVGGVLVGQDLLRAAAVRAQITQIEKYQTAVNTFRGKFNALPGDMNQAVASQFGFAARGPNPGQGDGNGLIQGYSPMTTGLGFQGGEPAVFWVDLSAAGLIGGNFSAATATGNMGSVAQTYPLANLANGNYVVVWSAGSANYLSVLIVGYLHPDWGGVVIEPVGGPPGINLGPTVNQAYAIDSKMDDGLPLAGNVQAISPYDTGMQYAGNGPSGNSAIAGTVASCYDNSSSLAGTPGVSGAAQHYSTEVNGGAGVNCPLSFQFK